jgi:hypothetical protein
MLAVCSGAVLRELLGMHHLDWSATRRKPRADARLVFFETDAQVICPADIKRPVGALEDVDERHPTTMPSFSFQWKVCGCVNGALRLATRLAYGQPIARSGLPFD